MAIERSVLETKPGERALMDKHPKAGAIPLALLLAMRPKQWTKNLFLYIALVFTNQIPTSFSDAKWRSVGISTVAFLLFCVISGAIYLMYDVFDREQDRMH